jgi:hypothetical protein
MHTSLPKGHPPAPLAAQRIGHYVTRKAADVHLKVEQTPTCPGSSFPGPCERLGFSSQAQTSEEG